jgi:hypothetical protein
MKLPIYYNADDIPVMIEEDGDDAVGKCGNGQLYPQGFTMMIPLK